MSLKLYLIEILHQTTTTSTLCVLIICCILSKFYIKPQLSVRLISSQDVVSYRNSTSNHNFSCIHLSLSVLYLIEILHQTTTGNWEYDDDPSCILSKFYIKPQLWPRGSLIYSVVSYRNSTSNHN